MTNDEKMNRLLADVQAVLAGVGGDKAKKVMGDITKLNEEQKMRGFRVVHRYRVKFTSSQWMISEENGKARRKCVAEINSTLAKLLNAGTDASEISLQMKPVFDANKADAATAQALLKNVLDVYMEHSPQG